MIRAKSIAVILIAALVVTSSAQSRPDLPREAAHVRQKAESLAPHSRISVIPRHGPEVFGELIAWGPESFTFHDIDSKTDVTLKYIEVRKLKSGYGGYNSARGTHTDHTKSLIVVLAVAGALGGLLAAVATSRN